MKSSDELVSSPYPQSQKTKKDEKKSSDGRAKREQRFAAILRRLSDTGTAGSAAKEQQEPSLFDRLRRRENAVPEKSDSDVFDDEARELRRQKMKELEKQFTQKDDDAPRKFVLQEEMGAMRRELNKGKININITYPVNPPFAFVQIWFNKHDGELIYEVKEPRLKEGEAKTLTLIKEKMEAIEDHEGIPFSEGGGILADSTEMKEYIRKKFESATYLFDIVVDAARKPILLYYLYRDLLGLGRFDPIFRDQFIEDIGCNGPKVPLYIFHRVFGSMKSTVTYPTELELNRFIFKLAQVSGKHISVYQPILDATLMDGSRVNMTLGSEVTRKGSTFSIRKFSYDPISPIDLLRFSTVSAQQLAYFWLLIENKKSILFSGETAGGKTTTMNAVSMFIKPEDKIVSIEDTPEIHIEHTNWIQSISRKGYGMASGVSSGIADRGGSMPGEVSLYDLLVAALRQRPEYVVVGEVRGKEAFTLFQAISVGHASMSTIHAGSIDELIHRIENEPMNIPRVMFQSLDAVAFVGQVFVNGKRARRVKNITEILEVERKTNNMLTNSVFAWNPKTDHQDFNGRSFLLENIARTTGKDLNEIWTELERRERYLTLMNERNITYYKDVSKAINDYYLDSYTAMRALEER